MFQLFDNQTVRPSAELGTGRGRASGNPSISVDERVSVAFGCSQRQRHGGFVGRIGFDSLPINNPDGPIDRAFELNCVFASWQVREIETRIGSANLDRSIGRSHAFLDWRNANRASQRAASFDLASDRTNFG